MANSVGLTVDKVANTLTLMCANKTTIYGNAQLDIRAPLYTM